MVEIDQDALTVGKLHNIAYIPVRVCVVVCAHLSIRVSLHV